MYELSIRINTDGDFSYKSSFIDKDRNEIRMLYDDRETAINRIIMFYKDIQFKASEEYFYIIKTIYDFQEYLIELSKRYNTFRFIFNFGNYEFEIELCKYSIVDYWVNSSEGITYNKKFNEEKIDLELYLNQNFKNKLDLNYIKQMKVIFPLKEIN